MEACKLSSKAAGGMDGLRRLAAAWHRRVMADDVVSHAFSHGFHPQHTERLAAYWAEALGGPAVYSDNLEMRPRSSGFTAAMGRTWRWTSERSRASIRRWMMSGWRATRASGACCTITSRGPPRPR